MFFLLGTFAFTAALDATSIPTRICAAVLNWSGTNTNKMLLGFMAACAFLSFFMSDVAACGVFISVGKRLLELNNAEPGKSALGKAIMIGIPWASFAGGSAVMTGNGCNVITVGLFQSLFGLNLTFVQWSMIGFPMFVILLFACWFILTRFYKPEDITQESIEMTMKDVESMGRITRPEKITVGVIAAAMLLWILSSWFSQLNTAMIAILAVVALSLPGNATIGFKELFSRLNWGVLVMIMCIISVAHFVVTTGAGDWIVTTLVAAIPAGWTTPVMILIVVSTIGAVLHNLVPVGPAVAGILAYPLGVIAMQFDVNMTAMLMLVAWQASFAFILPLDCVPVQTYSTGYYTIADNVKVGWIPTVVVIVLTATLIPALCMAFGMA